MYNMIWWKRLDERRTELGWSGKELARQSGIPYANINKYLNGEIEQPRGDVIDRLAKTVKKSSLWLKEGIDQEDIEISLAPGRLVPVAIAGSVEAGTFREVDDLDQSEPQYLSLPSDDRFPHARLMAFNVSGDSMNDLRPRPILPGDRVVCVSYEDIANEAALRDGMVVVVERTRDGGHTREWSIKQVEIYADRTEFHPRSTNPRHKPIVIERDMEADAGTSVQILGLVRRITNDLPF
ncbi:XRE family transcriptional regulator [Neorhizobium sp. T786]|uniref:XRE family transcriptional regulator n=1 Tax=Pseudorhizobium xiangyangii TaxID=2883104 RepID=UPI001CFFEF06|nr:XRE family transcriptional regulator [Neorhizobium xiangyangii]MCB5201908.1 XRE family transcriptional regulator [Neorhizobium xiangyangii]